ncbi:MAG: choice-of-anchor Q domain-containing protein [Candidatus Binatus sp.]
MAGSSRRFTFAAVALPFLFLVMSGSALAISPHVITVNTTDGDSDPFPLCTLPDAVAAHNSHAVVNGCSAGTGNDVIDFIVTGTIVIDEPLEITGGILAIEGPTFGCSGAGPCGITVDGGGSVQIVKADSGTTVKLDALTLNHGFASPGTMGGGAIFANGLDLLINDCLLVNNTSEGPVTGSFGGLGGAIFGNAGTIEIVNSTIANNTAEENGSPGGSEGGAIFSVSAPLKITNTTISGNQADFGAIAAIKPGLKGTIVAKNMSANCIISSAGDLNYNIEDDSSCGFSQPLSLNNTDPLLDPAGLQNNGGPTQTIALQDMSPAVDRIPVADCTDQQAMPQPLMTDQRLFARPDYDNLDFCDSGAYELGSESPIQLVPDTERVQIARSPNPNSDQINMAFTFLYLDDGDGCETGPYGDDDALNDGVLVDLFEGTCAAIPSTGLELVLNPFVVHTVNHQNYGTLFQTYGPETVSARMVAITQMTKGEICGEWTLNLEVAGANTSALNLAGGNPFALLISDFNPTTGSDATECFDITNAIVGNQIAPPPRFVRRGVRRQKRR